jgi:hypothetical protein
MLARFAADLVVVAHALFVVFVVFGGLLALYRRAFLWLHPPAAVWGFLIEVRGWVCPLTHLENHLRRSAGQAGYSGGFVEHYVIPVLYPQALTRNLQFVLAALVVVVNLAIYGGVLWRLGRRRWRARPSP